MEHMEFRMYQIDTLGARRGWRGSIFFCFIIMTNKFNGARAAYEGCIEAVELTTWMIQSRDNHQY